MPSLASELHLPQDVIVRGGAAQEAGDITASLGLARALIVRIPSSSSRDWPNSSRTACRRPAWCRRSSPRSSPTPRSPTSRQASMRCAATTPTGSPAWAVARRSTRPRPSR